jgi:hypothetical protein
LFFFFRLIHLSSLFLQQSSVAFFAFGWMPYLLPSTQRTKGRRKCQSYYTVNSFYNFLFFFSPRFLLMIVSSHNCSSSTVCSIAMTIE